MTPDSEMELTLLVESEHSNRASNPSFTLNGSKWLLSHFSSFEDDPTRPDYTCVSYIWGPERVKNPFFQAPEFISENTLPALSAAMHNSDTKAFWIDAFCIPTTQPARRNTLASMGFIYSQAKEVRVALSKDSFRAIQQLNTSDILDEVGLATLEQDKWVQSVWTYQEVVNSRLLVFVSPDAPGARLDGAQLLNGIGYTLQKYKEKAGLDTLSILEKYPSLDALEELIADWMIADYTDRSALAVMSNMDRRVWTDDQNYFFSMIGAVTSKQYRRRDIQEVPLSEIFMTICEEKDDFSFIFSSSSRSTDPARRWRPQNGLLPAILQWHSFGESQPGELHEDGSLWLNHIMKLQESPIGEKARSHIAEWLRHGNLGEADEAVIAKRMYAVLIRMGFTGREEFISLSEGLFYPQTILPSEGDVTIIVCTAIRWTFGAPGLAQISNGTMTYVPGVFAGLVNPQATCSVHLV